MQRSKKSFPALKFTLSAENEVSDPFIPFSIHTDTVWVEMSSKGQESKDSPFLPSSDNPT